MKKIKFGSILLALSFVSLTIASCNNTTNSTVSSGSSHENELTHTVTFNPNNGEATFTQTVKDRGFITEPETPVYEGHSFVGWFNSEEADVAWNFVRAQVTEDMTLTAKWTEDGSSGGNEDSSGGNQDSTGGNEDSSGGNEDSTGGSEDVFVPDGEVLTVGEALAIAKSLANGEKTTQKYYVEGKMHDIYNTQYGNCHLIDGNDDLIVYGLYSNDGSVRYDAMKKQPGQDDTILVYGVLMNYYDSKNSINKYEMENGWLMSVNGVEYSKYQESTTTGGNDDTSGDITVDITEDWTNTDFGSYYNSVNFDSSNLLGELQKLNSQKRTKTVGYSSMWSYFSQTDYDPNNPSKYLAFYQGTSASKGEMNKEHVWPKSHGSGGGVEHDIHAIRPTLSADNSSRGNSFYVEGMCHSSNGWDPKAAGMNEQYRGQAARIIFYCVVADSRLSLVDTTYSSTTNANPDYKMGKLSDLLKWNLQYGVVQSELNRNNGAEDIQGNRNPFIDNPKLACSIWGNTNAETKKICSGYTDVVDPDNGNNDSSNPSIENPDDSTSNNPSNDPSIIAGDELSFADKANRTTFTTSQQVWEQNAIKLINDKAGSSSNVADYSNPVRLYAASKVTIECANMTKIKFTCTSAEYATNLKNSIGTISNGTVTTSGNDVIVTFNSAVNSFVIASLTKQVRLSSLTVERS